MAYPSVYFYRNGVSTQSYSDYSYGITENWHSTAGSPQVGDVRHLVDVPNGGGFLPYTVPPLSPVWDLELGSFKYLTLDVKVSDTSHHYFIAHISRLPPGDVVPAGLGVPIFVLHARGGTVGDLQSPAVRTVAGLH